MICQLLSSRLVQIIIISVLFQSCPFCITSYRATVYNLKIKNAGSGRPEHFIALHSPPYKVAARKDKHSCEKLALWDRDSFAFSEGLRFGSVSKRSGWKSDLRGYGSIEVIQSTIHSTDTHGYTEAVFALMNLLGSEFAPRIAKIYKQQLYAFVKGANYAKGGYKILPDGYLNTELIRENWSSILRLITSIKLKECSASQIFKRLNSYSRQHPVYQALKEYGKIIKTLFILNYIDDVELRRSIRRQLNKIEHSNRFSSAICFANNGELIFLTRQEQLGLKEGISLIIEKM